MAEATPSSPCPVCGKDDWCLVEPDGSAAICQRVESGTPAGDAGWFHRVEDRQPEYEHPSHRQQNGSKPKPARKPLGKIVEIYDYADEAGKLLYQVVRFDPKDFRQRQPDGNGGWISNLTGVRRVIYRLPQILSRPDDMVFVVEGEKDADAGNGLGLLVTTSAQGAKSASKTDWTPLAGRPVTILPDNDSKGSDYCEAVIEQLRALKPPPKIRVLRLPGLPDKGDLFDYIESLDSKSPEDIASGILELARQQPIVGRRLQFVDMSASTELDPAIIEGVLRTGETANFIGSPKAGKSWLSYSLAYAVAYGLDWLGHRCQQGKVLLCDNELKESNIRHRLHQVYSQMHREHIITEPWVEARERIRVCSLRGKLVDVETLATAMLSELEPGDFKLIIVDALYRALPAGTSENDNAAATQIYNQLDRLAEGLGAAIVVVHHASKGSQAGKNVTDVGAGAGAIARAADSHLILRQHEADDVHVLEGVYRSFPPADPVCARFQWPLWKLATEFDPAKLKQPAGRKSDADKDAEALEALRLFGEPVSKESVRTELGINGQDNGARFRRLHKDGKVRAIDASTRETLTNIPAGKRVLWEPTEALEPVSVKFRSDSGTADF